MPSLPPMEFLMICTNKTLDDFELARLNRVANLRKELRALEDELRTAEAEVLFACWLREYRVVLALCGSMNHTLQKPLDFVDAPLIQAAAVHSLPGHVDGDADRGG